MTAVRAWMAEPKRWSPLVGSTTALAIGVGVSVFPGARGVTLLLLLLFALGWLFPRDARLGLYLLVLLLAPFDRLMAFPPSARGVPAVVLTLGLIAPALYDTRDGYLRPGLIAAMAALPIGMGVSLLATWDIGVIRPMALWAMAVAVFVVAQGWFASDGHLADGLLVLLSSVGGAIASTVMLARFTGIEVWRVIPSYEPAMKTLEGGWSRPSAMLGHPLILGSVMGLCLMASICLVTSGRGIWLGGLSTPMCAATLYLTGARGSWLAVAIGLGFMVLMSTGRTRVKLAALGLGVGACLAIVLLVTPLGGAFKNRLLTGAGDGASISQRYLALKMALSTWPRHPLFGHGFSRYLALFQSAGLTIGNFENEYVALLIRGGLIVAIPFVGMFAAAVRQGIRNRRSPAVSCFAGMVALIIVNAATYNMFDWSSMPLIFAVLFAALVAGEATPSIGQQISDSEPVSLELTDA